ncbi:MAG: signal peptidase I [Gemmatimonadota bacterium]|nr:signal peptidase I [Gemmatimonadota bacterium]
MAKSERQKGTAHRTGDSGSVGRWLWEWTKSGAVALLLFLLVRTFVVEAFQIPTGSMENTLLVGDFLLVNKMVYGAEIPGTSLRLPALDPPGRGDIAVFEPPERAGQVANTNYVKRIVGLPGDTLMMVDGQLYRNGVAVAEPYAKHSRPFEDPRSPQFDWQRSHLVRADGRRVQEYRPTRDNWGPIVVSPDSFFVMGDNRDNSEDSRYWGFVPSDAVKGRPLVIYFSYDRNKMVPFPWITEIRWGRLLSPIH